MTCVRIRETTVVLAVFAFCLIFEMGLTGTAAADPWRLQVSDIDLDGTRDEVGQSKFAPKGPGAIPSVGKAGHGVPPPTGFLSGDQRINAAGPNRWYLNPGKNFAWGLAGTPPSGLALPSKAGGSLGSMHIWPSRSDTLQQCADNICGLIDFTSFLARLHGVFAFQFNLPVDLMDTGFINFEAPRKSDRRSFSGFELERYFLNAGDSAPVLTEAAPIGSSSVTAGRGNGKNPLRR